MRQRLRFAYHHLSKSERYRYCGLYAALLIALVYAWNLWPVDSLFIYTLVEHPSLVMLMEWSYRGALILALGLGVIGMLRRPWFSRILGAGATLLAYRWLPDAFYHDDPIGILLLEALYWIFLVPIEAILDYSMDSLVVATPLIALYLGLHWLLWRPLFVRLGRKIALLANWIQRRFSKTRILARPLL